MNNHTHNTSASVAKAHRKLALPSRCMPGLLACDMSNVNKFGHKILSKREDCNAVVCVMRTSWRKISRNYVSMWPRRPPNVPPSGISCVVVPASGALSTFTCEFVCVRCSCNECCLLRIMTRALWHRNLALHAAQRTTPTTTAIGVCWASNTHTPHTLTHIYGDRTPGVQNLPCSVRRPRHNERAQRAKHFHFTNTGA